MGQPDRSYLEHTLDQYGFSLMVFQVYNSCPWPIQARLSEVFSLFRVMLYRRPGGARKYLHSGYSLSDQNLDKLIVFCQKV